MPYARGSEQTTKFKKVFRLIISFTQEVPVAYPGIFFEGGGFNKLRTEDTENGDLGAVAP
jgi:hypothetical protein